jgi:hypothetical protein
MSATLRPSLALAILLIALLPVGRVPVWAQETADAPPAAEQPATQEPPAAPDATAVARTVVNLLPDPRQWASEVFETALVVILRAIADVARGIVDAVLNSSLDFVFQTPPAGSYASPTVRALWGTTRAIANAALVLVALWGGVNLVVRQHVRAPYHDALELLPRLVLGALLANASLLWVQLAIDLNSALCNAIGRSSLPAWERTDAGSRAITDVLATLIYLLTSVFLVLQMLARLALVDVLIVVAPLGLLCWVLPQTQGYARRWSSAFVGAVFAQFLQVLTLKLGGSLLTELQPMAADAAFLALFLGVAVMILTLKVPGLLGAEIGSGLDLVRYVAYREAAQWIAGKLHPDRASRGKGGR